MEHLKNYKIKTTTFINENDWYCDPNFVTPAYVYIYMYNVHGMYVDIICVICAYNMYE